MGRDNKSDLSAWALLRETGKHFSDDNVLRLSAALAYYALFSLGPLLFIIVSLTSMAFGKDKVQHEVLRQLQTMLGANATQTVESMMAAHRQGSGIVGTVVGTVVLLVGASGVFGQLQDALNTIWGVKPKSGLGIWGFVRNRFLGFAMVLGTGFLLLISLVVSTVVSALSSSLGRAMALPDLVSQLFDLGVSILVVTLLFALIFKVLPDVQVKWRDVWIGALTTALLFTAGKSLIGFYLGREATASAYGAAGSVIIILLWIYYSSLILLGGAEFTQVYAAKTGSRIQPSENALPVSEIPEEKVTKAVDKESKVETVGYSPETFQSASKMTEQAKAGPRPIRPTARLPGANQTTPSRKIHAMSLVFLPLTAGLFAYMLARPKSPPKKSDRAVSHRHLPRSAIAPASFRGMVEGASSLIKLATSLHNTWIALRAERNGLEDGKYRR